MQLNQKMMMNFAVIAVFMSVMIMSADGKEKQWECCTSVSTKEITSPITGFRLQIENLPCVKAVIFYTAEGLRCSHWRERWVRQKIQELKKLQHQKLMTVNSTSSAPLSTTSS